MCVKSTSRRRILDPNKRCRHTHKIVIGARLVDGTSYRLTWRTVTNRVLGTVHARDLWCHINVWYLRDANAIFSYTPSQTQYWKFHSFSHNLFLHLWRNFHDIVCSSAWVYTPTFLANIKSNKISRPQSEDEMCSNKAINSWNRRSQIVRMTS